MQIGWDNCNDTLYKESYYKLYIFGLRINNTLTIKSWQVKARPSDAQHWQGWGVFAVSRSCHWVTKPTPVQPVLLWFIKHYLLLKQKPIKISSEQSIGGEGSWDWFMESYWNRTQWGVCTLPWLPSDIIISAMTERTWFVSFLLVSCPVVPTSCLPSSKTHRAVSPTVCLLSKCGRESACGCAYTCLNVFMRLALCAVCARDA